MAKFEICKAALADKENPSNARELQDAVAHVQHYQGIETLLNNLEGGAVMKLVTSIEL